MRVSLARVCVGPDNMNGAKRTRVGKVIVVPSAVKASALTHNWCSLTEERALRMLNFYERIGRRIAGCPKIRAIRAN